MTKFLHIIHWMKLVQNIQFHKMSLLQIPILESAASNDQISDGMECTAASMKRGVHEDSSDDDIYANPIKSQLPVSRLVSDQAHMCQERGEEKIWPRSPPSLPPLDQGNRGLKGDLYLPGKLTIKKSPPPPPHTHTHTHTHTPKPKEGHVKTPTLKKS